MIGKDKGHRKRKKLGREADDLKRKMSESGVPTKKMRPKRLLKYLKDSEDLKVGLGELKEQLETPEEASFSIVQITNQARNERGQKLFQIFRQEESEVYIASSARWDTQLKGLVELVDLMKEVELVCERQEGMTGMVVSKKDMQKEAPKKYHEKGFRGIQGVRGAKGKKKLWSSYKRSIC